MGIGGSSFLVRQKVGIWGEATFLNHFGTHPDYGLAVFQYGEAWSGKRAKEPGHAVCRPDLLLIENSQLEELLRRGINPRGLDLRSRPDDDPVIQEIVRHALVAVEVKFSHRRYVSGHVKFIIDEGRKSRYQQWLTNTEEIGALMVWLTTDCAWIATIDDVLDKGQQESRTYENRGGKAREKITWNLPVESAHPFAKVTGYRLNETLKSSFQWTKSGGVEIDVVDDPGDLAEVDITLLHALARQVRRNGGQSK